MNSSNGDCRAGGKRETGETGCANPTLNADEKRKKSLSMHDGIAVWCDCCSCEAEPYWAELADEMGIDLGSDYE